MYVYIYIYIYIYIYVYTHTHTHTHTYIYIHTFMYPPTLMPLPHHICLMLCLVNCVTLRLGPCIYIYRYIHIYTYI